MSPPEISYLVVNQISAMVAYWDRDEICRFANHAYLEWFGRTAAEMEGISLRALLGPLYEKNLPYIRRALRGEKQIFERQIPLPNGELRESIATYTPHFVDGVVLGFTAHVANVSRLRERERALEAALREKDEARRLVHTLSGLLPICAQCKSIRDEDECWHNLEEYVSQRAAVRFTHGLCPKCLREFT